MPHVLQQVSRLAGAALSALALALGVLAAWPAMAQDTTEVLIGDRQVLITPGQPPALTLDDPTGSLTLGQAQQALAARPATAGGAPATCAGQVCWMQVRLRSALPLDTEFAVMPYEYSDYVDLYVVGADGQVAQLRHTGTLGHAPSGLGSHYAVFTLRRGEVVTLYARFGGTRWFRFKPGRSIALQPSAAVQLGDEIPLYFGGLLVGGLLALGFYNQLIAVSTRDRSYMWYCCYLGFMALSFMGTDNFNRFFTPQWPEVGFWVSHTADFLMWISLMMFGACCSPTSRASPARCRRCRRSGWCRSSTTSSSSLTTSWTRRAWRRSRPLAIRTWWRPACPRRCRTMRSAAWPRRSRCWPSLRNATRPHPSSGRCAPACTRAQ